MRRAAHRDERATDGNERAANCNIRRDADAHVNADVNRDEESVSRARDLRGFGNLEGLCHFGIPDV